MNNDKKPWESKTVWAGVITAVLSALTAFGVISADEYDPNVLASQAVELSIALATLVSGVVAIYGRVTADKKITTKSKPRNGRLP